MSRFHDTFHTRVKSLFEKANDLDKPVRDDVTWTIGLLNGRNDYLDSQTHVYALVSSIIINEPVVPKILLVWDTWKKEDPPEIKDSKYLKVYQSPFRTVWPDKFSAGYRAKYLGLNMVKTPYGLMSDLDTICVKPCVDKYMNKAKESPEIFCWTNYKDKKAINSGFVVFNMDKYFRHYLPAVMRNYWTLPMRDSEFIKHLQKNGLKEKLTIGLIRDNKFIGTKFHWSNRRNDKFDETSSVYHAWKGDIKKGEDKFYDFYDGILDELEEKWQN